ncbi:MAG TPA: hypothetical protein VGL18_05320 [Actinomycetota bacterium]
MATALERLADRLPVMPGEDGEWSIDARRADALVALCSSRIAHHAHPDRATVVIHARLDGPGGELHSCEVEGGPAIHPEVAKRLACNGRTQVVLEDRAGQVVRLGRVQPRAPGVDDAPAQVPGSGVHPPRMRGQTVHPGPSRRVVGAGGPTDLDNLVLVCTFHHKLVHEYG